ncbi:MAG: NAD-binding protein [Acidimicrobiia bacterium]|nr:NAD-binding protein [Acidimicrobiia bacterium]
MRVAIAGAGNVGLDIANKLAVNEHEVLLIEQDPDVVELQSARTVEGVNWFCADACEVSSLHECELEKADVLVAVTGDDEDNLVISLLAKMEFAIGRVIARVNHPKNEWLFNETWGVDIPVSTPQLITAFVEEAVSVGTLVRLLQLEGGQARLVEITLAPDSPAIGQAVADLDTPRDSTFVAIVRDDHVVVPRGDTVFAVGDEVLALVTPDSEDAIRTVLAHD